MVCWCGSILASFTIDLYAESPHQTCRTYSGCSCHGTLHTYLNKMKKPSSLTISVLMSSTLNLHEED